ncbi:MAG: hypothetical protein ACK5WM_12110 [Rhodospirillales bacterium]
MRHAVVREGQIENIIVIAEPGGWTPPDGTTAHPLADDVRCDIGWAWDGGPVIPDVPPLAPAPTLPTPAETAAARAALDALVAASVISAEARAQMSPGPL